MHPLFVICCCCWRGLSWSQRLLRVRGFYSAIPRCSVVPLLQSLQMRDPVNVLATLNALAALLDCRCPADKKFDKPVAELAAKQAFYESKGYEVLINRVLVPYGRSPHSQVVAKVADMLALDLVDNATVRGTTMQTTRAPAFRKPTSQPFKPFNQHHGSAVECEELNTFMLWPW